MQKVSTRLYTILNIAIGVEMLLLAVAYAFFTFVNEFIPPESIGLMPLTAGMCAVAGLYAFTGFWLVRKKYSAYIGAIATLVLSSLTLATMFQLSGDFSSPLHYLWIGVVFASGAFGAAFIAIYISMVAIYFMFVTTGSFNSSTTITTALLMSGLDIVSGFISYHFWKHHYVSDDEKFKGRLSAANLQAEIVINSIADGVVVVDTEGKIVTFNPAASTITGWKVEDAAGLNFNSVLVLLNLPKDQKEEPSQVAPENHPITDALRSNRNVTVDSAILKTLNDKQLEITLVISPITANNAPSGAVAVFRDVSSQRKAERQRAEFISTASHEMRTPVAAIEGYLALAMNEKVSKIDTKARNYLEKAHESTLHLGQLFKDLLAAAKSEDGRLTNHPQVLDINQFLAQVSEDVRFSVEKKGLQLHYVTAGAQGTASSQSNTVAPLAYIHADPERIREVITNLINNGVKFTEDGSITVGLRVLENYVQISVQDTGYGIPAEDVPHLFQKFYRVDSTNTRSIGGTGLGLFICRNIIELYKGKIWVESEYGKGSTFFINLPRLPAEKAEELKKKEEAEVAPLQSEPTL